MVIFKKVHDEFSQKLRENKFSHSWHQIALILTFSPLRFILRDFTYDEGAVVKQQQELQYAEVTERELWTELLRLSRTNFSEAFQVLVHLKVVRLFVESVLRYGLPAEFTGVVVKVRHNRMLSSRFRSNQDFSSRTQKTPRGHFQR